MNVAVTVCASAWVTLKQIDSVARALTVSPTAQKRFKIAAIVGFRLAEIAILTATVLWATASNAIAQDVERCQTIEGLSEVAGEDLVQQSMAIPPVMEYVDIFADDDLVDDEPWEYGEDPSIEEELPALPGDVEVTADVDAVDLGAEFAAVAAY
jgi:hypothetical protein